MIGGKRSATIEQTDVECWEQQASASEINKYAKMGMNISKKIFFNENPNVTEQHEIVITSRFIDGDWVDVATADEIILDVASEARPDAGAGLGVVYRVMTREYTGQRT